VDRSDNRLRVVSRRREAGSGSRIASLLLAAAGTAEGGAEPATPSTGELVFQESS
jgi:hypothetical protein